MFHLLIAFSVIRLIMGEVKAREPVISLVTLSQCELTLHWCNMDTYIVFLKANVIFSFDLCIHNIIIYYHLVINTDLSMIEIFIL